MAVVPEPLLQTLHHDPIDDEKARQPGSTPRELGLIHITLVGMSCIVVMLYAAVLLPVFGKAPVTQTGSAIIMGLAAFGGIIGLSAINVHVHRHILQNARLTEVLVNSLGQGFLSFDHSGVCGQVYSQACIDMLQTVPAERNIADVLHVPPQSREDFRGWLEVLFDPTHALGFDDAVRFLPQTFAHASGRNIALSYKPIRNVQNVLTNVVVIITDRTEETAAQKLAEERQNFANMICRIFKERNQFITTISHIREFIALADRGDISLRDLPLLMRQLHTLKAAVRHFELVKLGALIHEVESRIRNEPPETDTDLLLLLATTHDAIAAEFGRVLMEVRALIGVEEEQRGAIYEVPEDDIYAFAMTLGQSGVKQELIADYCRNIASQPIRSCFLGFERELIELAQVMDKNLKPLQFSGGDIKILARPLKNFFFSLTHISRNIIDHGIEPPVTRMARHKDAAGQISVSVTSEQGWLTIIITDDGAGIDPNRLRQKFALSDPEGAWRFEDDSVIIQRIFGSGVSTRDGVTEISGRGVGLEVVLAEVQHLGGSVKVNSEIYAGTQFTIRLPFQTSLETSTI